MLDSSFILCGFEYFIFYHHYVQSSILWDDLKYLIMFDLKIIHISMVVLELLGSFLILNFLETPFGKNYFQIFFMELINDASTVVLFLFSSFVLIFWNLDVRIQNDEEIEQTCDYGIVKNVESELGNVEIDDCQAHIEWNKDNLFSSYMHETRSQQYGYWFNILNIDEFYT